MTDARIPVRQDLVMREVARERDELRAENADLLAEAERTAGIYEKAARSMSIEIERLRAALEEVKSYGHWSDCPAGASDKYRCRCPYGDLSEALGRDTE